MVADRILSNVAVHGIDFAVDCEAKRFMRAGRSANVAWVMAHKLVNANLWVAE